MIPTTWIDLLGVWIATLLTLSVYSFLVKDNFFYRLTEAIFVGVSVGYSIVVVYHNGIKPKIEEPLIRYVQNVHVDTTSVTSAISRVTWETTTALAAEPDVTKNPFNEEEFTELLESILYSQSRSLANTQTLANTLRMAYETSSMSLTNVSLVTSVTDNFLRTRPLVPLRSHMWVAYIFVSMCLGLLFLSRFSPSHAWLSRFPMAYLLGIGVGIGTPLSFQTQILGQLQPSIMPIVFTLDGQIMWVNTIGNISLIIGVLTVLYYFFFSLKKSDPLSKGMTHVGIAYLMIGFGASFAFTIMARVSLLAGRVDFLVNEAYRGTRAFFGF